jgi:hypothetical protein
MLAWVALLRGSRASLRRHNPPCGGAGLRVLTLHRDCTFPARYACPTPNCAVGSSSPHPRRPPCSVTSNCFPRYTGWLHVPLLAFASAGSCCSRACWSPVGGWLEAAVGAFDVLWAGAGTVLALAANQPADNRGGGRPAGSLAILRSAGRSGVAVGPGHQPAQRLGQQLLADHGDHGAEREADQDVSRVVRGDVHAGEGHHGVIEGTSSSRVDGVGPASGTP